MQDLVHFKYAFEHWYFEFFDTLLLFPIIMGTSLFIFEEKMSRKKNACI